MSKVERYGFTGRTKDIMGHTVREIVALEDFEINKGQGMEKIAAGTLGGWIEKEENLSEIGKCWIDQNSFALGNAVISSRAYVGPGVVLCDNAKIKGEAKVKGEVNAESHGLLFVKGNTTIYDTVKVWCTPTVENKTITLDGDIEIRGMAEIHNSDIKGDDISIGGAASVEDSQVLGKDILINAEAQVSRSEIKNHGDKRGDVFANITITDRSSVDLATIEVKNNVPPEKLELKSSISLMGDTKVFDTTISGSDIHIQNSMISTQCLVNGDGLDIKDADIKASRISASDMSIVGVSIFEKEIDTQADYIDVLVKEKLEDAIMTGDDDITNDIVKEINRLSENEPATVQNEALGKDETEFDISEL